MARPIVYSGDLGELLAAHWNGFAGRNEECVSLPQAVTEVGHTGRWKRGSRVVDLDFLQPGTVIANFKTVGGLTRFPNEHGFHVALFMSFGSRSTATSDYTHFWVLDQWHGHPVKRRNKNAIGADDAKRRHILPCDNANEYYVVLVP
jgi:hypothetical protein